MPRIFCLDLEGILVPEIWIQVAKHFRVPELKLTTRDITNYDKLMRTRLKILKRGGIRLRDIQSVIRKMNPLPGAKGFLNRLQRRAPVILLSDTYYEFAGPLIEKLGSPVLFCNELRTDRKGFISTYKLRQKDGKRKAVEGLKRLGFQVTAVGDSFNDLTMLKASHRGVLFNPPPSIQKKFRSFPVARNYPQLLNLLQ